MNNDIHTHLEKLKTELNKLEPAVKHLQGADRNTAALVSTASDLSLLAKNAQLSHESLIKSNERLLEKIDKVDFPVRLEKIDTTVSAINQGLQNTQTRIGDLERNFKDDLLAKTQDLKVHIESAANYLKQQMESSERTIIVEFQKQLKLMKIMKILILFSIGLGIGIVILYLAIQLKWITLIQK